MSTLVYSDYAVLFKDWFEREFTQWSATQDRRNRSIRKFGLWLGLPQQTVNNYINGDRVPRGRELDKIADKLGMEAYDAAGEPRPDERLRKIIQAWPQLSDEKREWLAKEAEQDAGQSESNSAGVAEDERGR